jgi:2-polyprenyl-3-methyl-5-hydroxy-6-metoxy-1,4-benzoquinol methylase
MPPWLLEILVCPACGAATSFDAEARESDRAEMVEGTLRCRACGHAVTVRGGIPRFSGDDASPFGNFAFQWKKWKTLQVDRLSGHRLSEARFLNDTGWHPAWLDGRLILDAGCGAGRFADVAAAHGAHVVACDISEAVEACRENARDRGQRVACLQASIYELPLRRDVFDGVYCIGVIQHTPDPERTMRLLPEYLKPGGRLAYNFYESGWAFRSSSIFCAS